MCVDNCTRKCNHKMQEGSRNVFQDSKLCKFKMELVKAHLKELSVVQQLAYTAECFPDRFQVITGFEAAEW